jgi:hypothetical protein
LVVTALEADPRNITSAIEVDKGYGQTKTCVLWENDMPCGKGIVVAKVA